MAGRRLGQKKYWTKERCHEVALRHEHRSDFQKENGSAYAAACINGWLDDVCGHMAPKPNIQTRHVYEIADHKRKLVYVGLTCNLTQRKYRHERSKKIVDNFPNGFDLYVLRWNLTQSEAQSAEAYFVEMYKFMGYTILNSAKTGGLGSIRKKWTHEACVVEALKYSTRKEFSRGSSSAYTASMKSGWLDEVCAHMREIKKPANYWTKDTVLAEARRYSNFTEFFKNSRAYHVASREGYTDEIREMIGTIRKSKGYWTKQLIRGMALKFASAKDFRTTEPDAYRAAVQNGVWHEICLSVFGHKPRVRGVN